MNTPSLVVNGTALRIIRERTGITLRELAARCDISPAHLSRIERGDVARGGRASPQVARALADSLRVPLAAITDSAAPVTSSAAAAS